MSKLTENKYEVLSSIGGKMFSLTLKGDPFPSCHPKRFTLVTLFSTN